MTKQDQYRATSIANLKVFLSGVLSFHYSWMKVKAGEPVQQQDGQIGNFTEEGQFHFVSDEEITQVSKLFNDLHECRKQHVTKNKRTAHLQRAIGDTVGSQANFRPQTCPASMKILEKKNPKTEMGENLSYADYLIQRGRATKEKHQKTAEEKNKKSTDGCSFKPTIL